MNTQGPDDASMLTILTHGTEYQREKFLKPLFERRQAHLFLDDGKGGGRRRHRHADHRREGWQ